MANQLRQTIEQISREKNIDPKLVEEVVCGNPDMAGAKSNPGRQVAIHAGCSWETVACTVNQQCVSSLRAAEIMYLDGVMKTEDAKEGIGAFMEKRKAVWKDK